MGVNVRTMGRRGVNSKNIEEVKSLQLGGLGIGSEQKRETRMTAKFLPLTVR